MSFASLFSSLNPRNLVPTVFKVWLDSQLGGAGTVEEIDFSFKDNHLSTVLQLEGEPEPVTVEVYGFRILADGTVTVRRVESSKAWLGMLLKKMADEGTFAIPEKQLDKLRTFLPLFK